jgi:fructose/tagatose bisphosphate aldolase
MWVISQAFGFQRAKNGRDAAPHFNFNRAEQTRAFSFVYHGLQLLQQDVFVHWLLPNFESVTTA